MMEAKKDSRIVRSSLLVLSLFLGIFLGSMHFLDQYSPENPIFTPSLLPEMMFRTCLSFDFYLMRLRNLVLPPQIRVLELSTGFLTSKAIYVACKYRIADLLYKRPLSTYELAHLTSTNPEKLARVMEHLHVQGLFKLTGGSKWSNTHLSWALQTSNPNNVLDEASSMVHKFYTEFSDLSISIHPEKRNTPPFISGDSSSSLKLNSTRVFRRDKGTTHITAPLTQLRNQKQSSKGWIPSLFNPSDKVQYYRLEKFKNKRVCEVREGVGSFLPSLLQAVPTSHGIILDRPQLLALTKSQFQVAFPELQDRVQFAESKFPHQLPLADIYVFNEVLNSLDDSSIVQLLSVISNLSAHGKKQIRVIWTDYELDHPYPHIHPLISTIDLSYLLTLAGKVRTVEEREVLLRKAGFEPILTRRVNSMQAITEARLANIPGFILES